MDGGSLHPASFGVFLFSRDSAVLPLTGGTGASLTFLTYRNKDTDPVRQSAGLCSVPCQTRRETNWTGSVVFVSFSQTDTIQTETASHINPLRPRHPLATKI